MKELITYLKVNNIPIQSKLLKEMINDIFVLHCLVEMLVNVL